MQYVDSSTLVKRCVREADSDLALRLLAADLEWVTAEHTMVEVRRTLAVRFAGDSSGATRARDVFEADWAALHVVALDDQRALGRLSLSRRRARGPWTHCIWPRRCERARRAASGHLRYALGAAARGLGWSVVGG